MKNITYNLLLKESADMPIVFRSACAYYNQESFSWAEGYTDFYSLQFIVEGSGILRCAGAEHKLAPGCAFFMKIGQAFEYVNSGGLKSAFISTVGSVPEEFAKRCIDGYLFLESVNLKKFIPMIEDIVREYYLTSKKSRLSSLAYEILAEFFTEAEGASTSTCDPVMGYIKRNFTKKITLEDISRSVGISVSKLCHDFKRDHGCSVFTKIKNLRLDYAKELLSENGELKIKDAAALCGFDDLSYFCSAYKARFASSPLKDRKA
jgi:AraC-like DNA-binding protein